MLRISLLSILLWMVTSCVFDTTVRNISNLNFEFYLSFMITSAMELPADLLSIVGITWLGRRWSASLSLLLCGLTMMVCAFVKGRKIKSFHSFHLRLEFIVLQITAFLIGRIFANYAMNVGLQYTVEVMPTCLRGQGTALVNVMSMLSQMASPYIVYSVRIRVQRTDCHNHNNTSVRHIREGSLPHNSSPLRPRGHSQPLPPGDS